MEQFAFGWLPDYPDFRDKNYLTSSKNAKQNIGEVERISVRELREKAGVKSKNKYLAGAMPVKVDYLEKYFPSVEQQGVFQSCTAHAGTALVEYFENKAFGDCEKKSRSFLYKATRNLLNFEGDTGAFVRTTMKAMVLFGIPPEKYWPYNPENINKEPTQFSYAFAQNFQALQYYRLDIHNMKPEELLRQIKINLVKSLPMMFGFTVYSNIIKSKKDGIVRFPSEGSRQLGGHAVVAVGYDDHLKTDAAKTKGALRIRNSWGEEWGDSGGYGWLPYEYILKGLAKDFWSLIKNEWINTKMFE